MTYAKDWLGRLCGWVFRRKDVVVDGELHLRRFHLTPKSWRYRLYVHHLVTSDALRDPHDHPWWFVSFCWAGSYRETIFNGRKCIGQHTVAPWSAPYLREATHTHIVEVLRPCWTLVLAGPQAREWGFWTKDGWVSESEYKKRGEVQSG